MKKLTLISSMLLVLIIMLFACSQETTISVEEEIIGDLQKTAEQEKFNEDVKTMVAGTFAALADNPESTPTIMPTEESISVQERSLRGSQIQELGIIQIGVRNDDMYPMNFQEESIHKGFEIDLAIEIVSRIFGDELDIEWIPLAAQERIEAVQNEDVDFLIRNLTHTKSRAELVLFSITYFLEGGSESEPLAIAVSQTDPVFLNNIDRILLEIIEDGTWQNIYDRWFDDPPTWTIEDMLSLPPATPASYPCIAPAEVSLEDVGNIIEVCGKVTKWGNVPCPECALGGYSFITLDKTFTIISYDWRFNNDWVGDCLLVADTVEQLGSNPIFIFGKGEGYAGSECTVSGGTMTCSEGEYFLSFSDCD